MLRKYTLICFGLLCLVSIRVQGQEVTDSLRFWRIETIDGSEFLGTIMKATPDTIYLKNQSVGLIAIPENSIIKRKEIIPTQYKNGQVWAENPQASRYFWAPNGYGMKKGEGYYQNVWVMFNQVSYGFSSYFTIGTGVMPLFLFGGAPTPIWITPKVSVPIVKDKLNMGGGLLFGTIAGESNSSFGITYGVVTFGNQDANITFGMGYGFAGGEWSNQPLFELSAMARISDKCYLLTENYYINTGGDNYTILTIGGRTAWPKISIDYGLLIPISVQFDQLIAIPWLGFVVPFGK